MRIFIGEYICGGGFLDTPQEAIPASLLQEGRAMLSALAADFAEFAETVHVPLDSRLDVELPGPTVRHPLQPGKPLWPQWIAAAEDCDHCIVIAPESHGVLAQSVAMMHAAGLNMLNGYGDFLRCVSDKWETARVFAVGGVSHPPTWQANGLPSDRLPAARRWVVKPTDGCGTEDIQVFDSIVEAAQVAEAKGYLIQPWIEGRAVSVAVIVDGNEITVLPAVKQHITAEAVVYQGGCGPLDDDDQRRATKLATAALQAVPRTARGYLGLDLVLADDPAKDCVIEINPRLTTSYVGLRHIVAGNLAKRLVGLDRSPVKCQVGSGQICWDASGHVWNE